MFLFDTFRILHILAGFTALLLFWIPIVTKKGGKTHKRIGWVYVISMTLVSISAIYMGFYRIFFAESEDISSIAFSWFLIYIAILSSSTAWYGIRVLRYKKREGMHRDVKDLSFPLLLIISGIFISIYGFQIQVPLLSYFPILGLILGITQLQYWLRKPNMKQQWYLEHLGGMLGCCIATITAFTVFWCS